MQFGSGIKSENERVELSLDDSNINPELNLPFTKSEVSVVLANTKTGKAQGLDGVVADTLRNRSSIDVLTALSKKWYHTEGIISRIPKTSTGDPRIPINCRGISLLPVITKVYSACICNRISSHLETNDMLCNEQNGFRPGRS